MTPDLIQKKLTPLLTDDNSLDRIALAGGCLFSAVLILGTTTGSYLVFSDEPSLAAGLILGLIALVIAFFLGKHVNEREDYYGTETANRGAEMMAEDSWGPWGRRYEAGESMVHWGCMLAIWQFIFGNFYASATQLFEPATVTQDELRFASGVIAVVRKAPTAQDEIESSLGGDVVAIRKCIGLLLEKGIIRERKAKLELPPEMRKLFK